MLSVQHWPLVASVSCASVNKEGAICDYISVT